MNDEVKTLTVNGRTFYNEDGDPIELIPLKSHCSPPVGLILLIINNDIVNTHYLGKFEMNNHAEFHTWYYEPTTEKCVPILNGILNLDLGFPDRYYLRVTKELLNFLYPKNLPTLNPNSSINHPSHYGKGKDDPYEVIKVIDAWNLNFPLGNVVKYVARAGKKTDNPIEDLEKAKWYLEHEIQKLKDGL